MWDDVPIFGKVLPGVTYRPRPGAYGIVRDAAKRIAVLRTEKGLYLPGGGCDPGESLEETLLRELVEECQWEVGIRHRVGAALEYVYAEGEGYFRKECTFYEAEVVKGSLDGPDIVWLEPGEAAERLKFGSQRWAIREAQCLQEYLNYLVSE